MKKNYDNIQSFFENIGENRVKVEEQQVKMMAPLVLAYVGDAVFEMIIRDYLINQMTVSVHQYHKRATRYVRAKAQAKMVHALEEQLSEEEWAIVKKGRNQKSATVPKNADITDYRYATGFEALLGYLFYKGSYSRLHELVMKGIEMIDSTLGE